jgi:ribosomal protein L1
LQYTDWNGQLIKSANLSSSNKIMFWNKKIETKEYLELKKEIDKLRIAIETLDIEVKLYKNKLRTRAKIDKDEETQNINNSVLLPE